MALASPVELVKSKVDLVQLVSSYVPELKKSGRNWWACCPFHSEKTPSFCLWPADERWKCFGCGAGGDAFAFIMRIENLDFGAALRLLAERTGVQLEDRPAPRQDTAQRRRLLEINAAASLWFHNQLLRTDLGAAARAYVEKRHLTRQTVQDFQLGYAPDSWDLLRTHLLAQGYAVEEQLAAGVLHESDRGTPYDRFRNRLIFPIHDAAGHVIALGGRDLGGDAKSAKFINSPQSEVFDKSVTLYGLDRAKNDIKARDRAIIVEGYMDAIMAHQHGVTIAVCSMGTSLTERQVEQVKKLTTNLILALDPDTAGDIAAGRGVEIGEQTFDQEVVPVPSVNGLIRMGTRLKADIRVMSLPRGQDPDEVIHQDLELWNQLVENAVPLLEYKFLRILEQHDLADAKGKADAVAELGQELAKVPDPVERNHYLGKMTQQLVKLAGPGQLKEGDVQLAMARALPAHGRLRRPERPAAPVAVANPAPLPASALGARLDVEDYLVMRALRYLDAAECWRNNLGTEEIDKSVNREILDFLRGVAPSAASDNAPDFNAVPDGLRAHLEGLRTLALNEPEIPPAALEMEFQRLIQSLRVRNAVRAQAARATLLSEAEGPRQPEVEAAALTDLAALHHAKLELGRRTMLARS